MNWSVEMIHHGVLNADELMLLSGSNWLDNSNVYITFLESHLQHSQITLSFSRSVMSVVRYERSQPSQKNCLCIPPGLLFTYATDRVMTVARILVCYTKLDIKQSEYTTYLV